MHWTPEDMAGFMESGPVATHRPAPTQALTEIIQLIPDRLPMTAADLGCANPERLSLLAAHFGDVLAVSGSESGLAAARLGCPDDNVRYAVGDFADLSSLAGSIDVALAMDVDAILLEAPLDHFIEQVHSVLVEGGILLLSVPAAQRIGGPVELHLGKPSSRPVRRSFHEVELQYRVRRAGFQGLRIKRFEAAEGTSATLLCTAVRRALN